MTFSQLDTAYVNNLTLTGSGGTEATMTAIIMEGNANIKEFLLLQWLAFGLQETIATFEAQVTSTSVWQSQSEKCSQLTNRMQTGFREKKRFASDIDEIS